MLLIMFALFTGCEEGSNGDDSGTTATNRPPTVTVIDETSSGQLTTTTISGTNDPNASGPPYEGDTRIEEYVFTKPDGTAGSGTKTYVYTDGEWVLTGSSGDPF